MMKMPRSGFSDEGPAKAAPAAPANVARKLRLLEICGAPACILLLARCQNSNRATICICRGWKPFARLVTWPKPPEPYWKEARSKRERLRALNASIRTCNFLDSRILNSFLRPRSTFSMPCEVRLLKYRGAFPSCWSPGSAKQLALNTEMPVVAPFRSAAAAACGLTPVPGSEQVTLGRCEPLASRLRAIPIWTGCPLCNVRFDDADQPPMTLSSTGFMSLPRTKPRPTGRFTVNAAATRFVALLALRLYSLDNRSRACGPPLPSHPTQLFPPEELLSVARASV